MNKSRKRAKIAKQPALSPARNCPDGSASSIEPPAPAELGTKVELLPPEEAEHEPPVGEGDDETVVLVPERGEDSGSGALVPYDSLAAYIREISQYPPLTRQREYELAVRYFESKDKQAAYELIVSNLILVVKIARKYERAARNILDLIQEGNIGLMEAVRNFTPYRGIRFPSYAVWWIKAYIIRYLMANWRMVKIGTTQAQRKLFFNLKKEKEKLEREGFYPGPRLLAEKLQVHESDVIEMEQRLSGPDLSVDAPLQPDSEASLLSMLPDQGPSTEDLIARRQIQELIKEGLQAFEAGLNAKEQAIFKQRMLSEDKATLHELSEQLSLSRERIRQLENRIREKLKKFISERFKEADTTIDLDSLD